VNQHSIGSLRHRVVSFALGAAVLAASSVAVAQSGDQARLLFEGGAAMYDKAHYVEAAQAFEAAYRLSPRPGVLFSIAQAHKKQFFFAKSPADLAAALKAYREYVEKNPTGSRRGEAVASIAELEPFASRIDMSQVAAAPAKVETRILVQSSAPGVVATVDGAASGDDTLHWTVKPGKHLVKASAPGYLPQEREVNVRDGDYESVLFDLKELPAHLTVAAPGGATVAIDGRPAGTTPLLRPLDIEQGTHLVTVTRNGYKAYSEEIEFAHGEDKHLAVELHGTAQRVVAYVTLGAGAAAAIAGGVFFALALKSQSSAQTLDSQRTAGTLSPQGLADYNDDLTQRDDEKRIAAIGFGAAVALGAGGLLLYAFDQPTVGEPAKSDDRSKKKPLVPNAPRELEMSFAPSVAPGYGGGAFTLRF
jgi:hypothetical protein